MTTTLKARVDRYVQAGYSFADVLDIVRMQLGIKTLDEAKKLYETA